MQKPLFTLAMALVTSVVFLAATLVAAQQRVTGTATYRERIALPANAVFTAVLEEVGRADAPATEISGVTIESPGQPPIAFAIEYAPAAIEQQRTYAVRARIAVGDRLMFASDTAHRVLTRGSPSEVAIVMRMVRQRAEAQQHDTPLIGAHGLRLPGTFVGDLPCADCAGIRHHLNLWPDQVFHLRRSWLGKERSRDDIGRWYVDPERRALILRSGAEAPLQFGILGPARLRQLDLEGRPIVSDLPYELAGSDTFRPLEVKLGLRGMFTYMADAARITECMTGRSYPVAMAGDYRALEQAYLAARPRPGGTLLASFEGRIAEQPRLEGTGTQSTVLVDRFINVWPGENCERTRSEASLTNTYWRIVRLGGQEIRVAKGGWEPYLLLRTGEPRYAATVGCNQLLGSYETAGETLRLKGAASTMMACPPPLAEYERLLAGALQATATWRINGQVLELLDGNGQTLALLQAVHLR